MKQTLKFKNAVTHYRRDHNLLGATYASFLAKFKAILYMSRANKKENTIGLYSTFLAQHILLDK